MSLEPCRFKAGIRDRGQVWAKIANNLNKNSTDFRFIANQGDVRGQYTIPEKTFRRKMATQKKASGITAESTKLDQAIKSIIGRREGVLAEIARHD